MWSRQPITRFFLWLTESQHNLKSFAVVRIMYAIGLLFMLVASIPDRALIWGHASFWVDPEARRRGYWTFDMLMPKDSPMLFDLAFFGMIGLAVLFLLGWRTRVVTPLLLFFYVSLQSNNGYVLNGGDTLMRITLTFMLLANLSEYFSLDARRRKRQAAAGKKPPLPLLPSYVTNAAHNLALILCCFQIMVVYTASGYWKLTGSDWLEGTALFYALRLDAFMAYPLINELLWQSSLMIYVATFVALWVQTLFPLLVIWRPTRIFTLVSLVFMHLGIAVLLGLWPFSLAMIALDMLYVRDTTWSRMGAWFRGTPYYARGSRLISDVRVRAVPRARA